MAPSAGAQVPSAAHRAAAAANVAATYSAPTIATIAVHIHVLHVRAVAAVVVVTAVVAAAATAVRRAVAARASRTPTWLDMSSFTPTVTGLLQRVRLPASVNADSTMAATDGAPPRGPGPLLLAGAAHAVASYGAARLPCMHGQSVRMASWRV